MSGLIFAQLILSGVNMRKFAILLSIVSTVLVFQNCSEEATFLGKVGAGSSSEDTTGVNNGSGEDINDLLTGDEVSDIGIIEMTCKNSVPLRSVVPVSFPKPKGTCAWEEGGNLDIKNQYFQARLEQKRNLNLPDGAVICDAHFDFEQQDFLYDDHFLLTFNDSVIAASYDFSQQLTAKNLGLLKFEWDAIAGIFWDVSKETIFCPQIPGAQASCDFPGHDMQGKINLDYDPLYVQAIMSQGIPSNHSFTMITIGDNDKYDCEHSEVNFDVTVDYVIPAAN